MIYYDADDFQHHHQHHRHHEQYIYISADATISLL